MKIIATSDIHYDLSLAEDLNHEIMLLLDSIKSENPDVLIIAGDMVGLGWRKLKDCLHLFAEVAPQRMVTFGNHEYWSSDQNTYEHLEELETIIEESGFHLLDKNPKIIGNTGFVGNCSWYDYSFAEESLFPASYYERKTFHEHVVWNDALFVRLKKSDPDYAHELVKKLEDDIRNIERDVETIVAVTHHIGFQEMIRQTKHRDVWNFTTAFMGTDKLGEMLLKYSKVKYHVCGHTHYPSKVEKNGLVSINTGSSYRKKRYITIVIRD